MEVKPLRQAWTPARRRLTMPCLRAAARISSADPPPMISRRTSSVMSITIDSDTGNPVGVVAASNSDDSSIYVIAIDLELETLLWQYRIDEGKGYDGGTSGQFAQLINDQGMPVLVFSTRRNGVWGIVLGP